MTLLNIVLIENDLNSTLLEYGLKGAGFKCLKTQHSSQFLEVVKKTAPDAVIFNLDTPSEKITADLHHLSQHFPLPVIMFATDITVEAINQVIKAGVSELIVNGLENNLPSIIHIAIARFNQQQVLKHALEEARVQLEDRKQIDRAKAILIKTRNFTENEAYHTLRKLAMDRSITLGEMAKNVIAMAELLK